VIRLVRERLENQMLMVLSQINKCDQQILAADAARRERGDLRRELARLAALYAGVEGMEDAEQCLDLAGIKSP
jgi:ribosomal protein S2